MRVQFNAVLKDVTRKGTKIQTDEYLTEGKFPIIDQGNNDIAGYRDDETGLFTDVPAIVFGDHTRIVKYITEPFFLGADGVKVLVPIDRTMNCKYLYYQLLSAKIPDTGYNRHFKWVKELEFQLPSRNEQDDVVKRLDKLCVVISARQQQLAKLDELVKSRFVEMFGDPFLNLMNWNKIKIANAVTVEPQNGMYKPQSNYVTDGTGTPILRIDSFYDGEVTDFSLLKRLVCNEEEKQKYALREDDIIINRVNSIEYLGKCARITGLKEETVYESNMMRMHFDSKRFNPIYIIQLLCSQFIYRQIVNHAKKAINQASINQKDVLDFDIYEPPIELQNTFGGFVKQTEQLKLPIQKSIEQMETLKKALMQQYFG